jgi:CHAT domain-containing protein
VILEACYSGRYLGPRTGDPISLAAVALLAGASNVIASLFALPASDTTTGAIAALTAREILRGTSPPEALRRARSAYLRSCRPTTRLPGTREGRNMPGDAPWAWAGLVSYSR